MSGPGHGSDFGFGRHQVSGNGTVRGPRRSRALIKAAIKGAMDLSISGRLPLPSPGLRAAAAAMRAGAMLFRARRERAKTYVHGLDVAPTVESIERAVEEDVLLPGDVLAFSGRSRVSRLIRSFTVSRISHVGIVYDSMTIVESTTLRDFRGVVKHPIANLGEYHGKIWRLRLIDRLAEDLDPDRLAAFLDAQVGKEYDVRQAALSGIDWFWRKTFETERDFAKWFCSELVTAALADQGLIGSGYNPSEATPADVWRWNIWETKRPLDLELLSEMREPADDPLDEPVEYDVKGDG